MASIAELRKKTGMDLQRLKPIKTAHGMLRVYRNWGNEGAIYMENPQTINRYKELGKEEPDSQKYGIFWAFSDEQFEEGKEKMKQLGFYQEGQKIYAFGGGGYGTSKELIDDFFNFYKNRRKRMAAECDPQEVYIYEYNNHECMLDWDGDDAAYKLIVDMYGEEVAKGITRFSVKN